MSLLKKMLEKLPENRLTAEQCLKHEYFKKTKNKKGKILKNKKMMKYN